VHDAWKNSSTIPLVDGNAWGLSKAVTGFFVKLLAELDGKNLFKMAHMCLHYVAPKCAGFNQYRTSVALPVILYNGLFYLVRGRKGGADSVAPTCAHLRRAGSDSLMI
jgi:hypothetical protein